MSEAGDRVSGKLATEHVRAELARLDTLSSAELVELMAAEARKAPEAVIAARGPIVAAVDGVAERMRRGGRLVYVGAGSSGRLGVLDAAEAGPTFDVRDGEVAAVLAGGPAAFDRPSEAAEDALHGALADLERLAIGPLDAVVGITASGRTPFVIGALDWVRERGGFTVSIACNVGAEVSGHADVAIELDVGSEVIAGSTRMNSGTAQKIALNILSTAVMVRRGKTYGNRMVHMRATNVKLRDRAVRMVSDLTDADATTARGALEEAGWETKVAIAMVAASVDAGAARSAIDRAGGSLRKALAELGVVEDLPPAHRGSRDSGAGP